MTVVGFIFFGLITIAVNILVTAFLIARNNQSKKIMQDVQENAQSIIRQVNRATVAHTTIADNTVKDLTLLIEEARRNIDNLSKTLRLHNFENTVYTQEINKDKTQKQQKTRLVPSKRQQIKKETYVSKNDIHLKPKDISKKKQIVKKSIPQKTHNKTLESKPHNDKSLPNNIEFQKLIEKKLDDEEIASMLELNKAEVALARFVLKNSH